MSIKFIPRKGRGIKMEKEMLNILSKYGQEHLIKFCKELSLPEEIELEDQILETDFEEITELYESTKITKTVEDKIEPMQYVDKYKLTQEERERYEKIGDKIISKGKYAVATMAGGQGTRLGHNGPKGTFELIDGKSLFEIFCDELKKANEKYNTVIPWYIMTSKENNIATRKFFKEKNYFGYPEKSVKFFEQGELPMIDMNRKSLAREKMEDKKSI